MQSLHDEILSPYAEDQRSDPYPNYRLVQRFCPVFYDENHSTWFLTSYNDTVKLLSDARAFSNKRPISLNTNLPGNDIPLFSHDPPEHSQLRSLIAGAFTARACAALRPWMEEHIDTVLDTINPNEVDIAQELLLVLPVVVIAKILGLPVSHWQQLKSWTESSLGYNDVGDKRAGRKAYLEMYQLFQTLTELKRQQPEEDIISMLANANLNGKPLSDSEILNYCAVLLIAGNETTSGLMGNMLNILAHRPRLWLRLRNDRALVDPVIEETLRYETPVHFVSRIATIEVEFNGKLFPPGTLFTACIGAANRDPAVFSDPDTFNPERPEKKHLGFGHGIHFCPGATLSRLETNVLLNKLLDRFKTIRVIGEGTRYPSVILRGFSSLRLQLHS